MALRGTPPALRASIGPAGCWKGRFGGTALGSTGVYWGAGPRDAFTGEAGQWGTGSDRAAAQWHGTEQWGAKKGHGALHPNGEAHPPHPTPPSTTERSCSSQHTLCTPGLLALEKVRTWDGLR